MKFTNLILIATAASALLTNVNAMSPEAHTAAIPANAFITKNGGKAIVSQERQRRLKAMKPPAVSYPTAPARVNKIKLARERNNNKNNNVNGINVDIDSKKRKDLIKIKDLDEVDEVNQFLTLLAQDNEGVIVETVDELVPVVEEDKEDDEDESTEDESSSESGEEESSSESGEDESSSESGEDESSSESGEDESSSESGEEESSSSSSGDEESEPTDDQHQNEQVPEPTPTPKPTDQEGSKEGDETNGEGSKENETETNSEGSKEEASPTTEDEKNPAPLPTTEDKEDAAPAPTPTPLEPTVYQRDVALVDDESIPLVDDGDQAHDDQDALHGFIDQGVEKHTMKVMINEMIEDLYSQVDANGTIDLGHPKPTPRVRVKRTWSGRNLERRRDY